MNISCLLSRFFRASFTQPVCTVPGPSQIDAARGLGRQYDPVADFREHVWYPNPFADQAGLLLTAIAKYEKCQR